MDVSQSMSTCKATALWETFVGWWLDETEDLLSRDQWLYVDRDCELWWTRDDFERIRPRGLPLLPDGTVAPDSPADDPMKTQEALSRSVRLMSRLRMWR